MTFAHLTSLPQRLRGWRADCLALAAGILAAAALPPVHAIPVLLISIPSLLSLIDTTAGPWVALRRGWCFGFGLHVAGLYWITEAILIESARFWWLVPLAVPGLAAVLALFIGVAAGIARLAVPGWRRCAALAGAWTLADLARQFVATGFPWNPLGSVWEIPGSVGDIFIQPAAWISVHGLTLATLLLAATPALDRRLRAIGLALFAIWGIDGLLSVRDIPPGMPASPTVVVVQGNVPQGQKFDHALAMSIFERYLRLTADGISQAANGSNIVVWPETAVPYLLQTDRAAREAITDVTGDAIDFIGGIRFGVDDRPRNSLFALAAGGIISQIFDKWHLVPFGEYGPEWLPDWLQLAPGGGFVPGPGPMTLTPPGIPPVGPLICYEAIFPGEIVDRQDRPAWLVNVTNDAWFGNSAGPRQHLAAARMRAVEEGLPLIRAANTGISAIFDGHGHEIGRIGMGRTGVLVAALPPNLEETFFARFGLMIPTFIVALTLVVGLLPRRPSRHT